MRFRFALPYHRHIPTKPTIRTSALSFRLYPINGGWHSLNPIGNTIPSTMDKHSQSIILKVPKPISSPRHHFHVVCHRAPNESTDLSVAVLRSTIRSCYLGDVVIKCWQGYSGSETTRVVDGVRFNGLADCQTKAHSEE